MKTIESTVATYEIQEQKINSGKIAVRYANSKYHEARALEEKAQMDWMIACNLAKERECELLAANEDLRVAEAVLDAMAKAIAAEEAEQRKVG